MIAKLLYDPCCQPDDNFVVRSRQECSECDRDGAGRLSSSLEECPVAIPAELNPQEAVTFKPDEFRFLCADDFSEVAEDLPLPLSGLDMSLDEAIVLSDGLEMEGCQVPGHREAWREVRPPFGRRWGALPAKDTRMDTEYIQRLLRVSGPDSTSSSRDVEELEDWDGNAIPSFKGHAAMVIAHPVYSISGSAVVAHPWHDALAATAGDFSSPRGESSSTCHRVADRRDEACSRTSDPRQELRPVEHFYRFTPVATSVDDGDFLHTSVPQPPPSLVRAVQMERDFFSPAPNQDYRNGVMWKLRADAGARTQSAMSHNVPRVMNESAYYPQPDAVGM